MNVVIAIGSDVGMALEVNESIALASYGCG